MKRLFFLLSLIALLLPLSGYSQVDGIYADFITSKGTFRCVLYYRQTPVTCANFIGLAEGRIKNATYPAGTPFYDNSPWHRVVKGHVIQGGSPALDIRPQDEETGVTGYTIPDEITTLSHNKAGMLGMAHMGPNTATCQYYITLGDRSYLDGIHTVFGEVVSGMDVVNSITQSDTTYAIHIIRVGKAAGDFRVDDQTFASLTERQWAKVEMIAKTRKKHEEKYVRSNFGKAFQQTPSGLRYKIVTAGAESADTATTMFSYRGWCVEPFLSFVSTSTGAPSDEGSPELFPPQEERGVTRGLLEGISGMKNGEARILVIPDSIAYGHQGYYAPSVEGRKRFVIPPDRMIILEVTMK